MYIRKWTTELSARDCRDLKQACAHARELRQPLNTLVTFAPYPGTLPTPAARSIDLNRLLSHLRMWLRRHLHAPLVGLWVWHSDVTGRNPHVHVFLHCPKRLRNDLRTALDAAYPEPGLIDVSDGYDIRQLHHSGFLGSTLDYLMRFKSQQAWWADKKTYRQSVPDENGRRRGTKSPITGKRWGCTRNIASRAIDARLGVKAEAATEGTHPNHEAA